MKGLLAKLDGSGPDKPTAPNMLAVFLNACAQPIRMPPANHSHSPARHPNPPCNPRRPGSGDPSWSLVGRSERRCGNDDRMLLAMPGCGRRGRSATRRMSAARGAAERRQLGIAYEVEDQGHAVSLPLKPSQFGRAGHPLALIFLKSASASAIRFACLRS